MTPEDIKTIEDKDNARVIYVFQVTQPTESGGTFCHACMMEDLSIDLKVLRAKLAGQKCISIYCRPVAEGHFCLKHGIPLVKKVKEYVNTKADEILKGNL